MRTAILLRIVLCGVIAGVVWFVLSAVLLALCAEDFLAFVRRGGSYPALGGGFFFAVDLLMGVWAVWLYSALVPRYGAGLKTAALAGLAWWIIKSLQSAKWVGLGLMPSEVVVIPLVTSLGSAMAAAIIGGWLYERVTVPAANRVSSS